MKSLGKLMNGLADKALGRLVPPATAAAGCAPQEACFYEPRSCSSNYRYYFLKSNCVWEATSACCP